MPRERALHQLLQHRLTASAHHGGHATLQAPTQQNLRRGLAHSLRDLDDHQVLQELLLLALLWGPQLMQGAQCHALHALAEAHTQQFALRQEGLQLHLVHDRLDACPCQQVFHLLETEVGHAQTSDEPCVNQLLQGTPGIQGGDAGVDLHLGSYGSDAVAARHNSFWEVHHIQVQVSAPQINNGLLAGSAYTLWLEVFHEEFACDEQLRPMTSINEGS
mmetsp:Transcript_17860/g.30633  ORF Transcript_17860/g.30633 Transcript_17860/m.30633 type:complete len:218 (-) Transcript_17860:524-1177(-)